MDTPITNEPAGGEGATSSQDTSDVGTQIEETSPSVSDGQEQTSEATETLLAGKYKSPEELERGYKELEGKLGDLGQKAAIAEIIQEKFGLTPEQFKQTLAQQEQARLEQEYKTNPAGFALREVEQLKSQIALQEEERKLDSFLHENPEYTPHRDKIQKLALTSGIGFDPVTGTAKGYDEIAREWIGGIRAQGQQDAYKKIETKKMTQATGSMSTPPRTFSQAELDNMTAAELEAILPHADTSNRLY